MHACVCVVQRLIPGILITFLPYSLRQVLSTSQLVVKVLLASLLDQGIPLALLSKGRIEASYLITVIYVWFGHPNSVPLAWAASTLTTEETPQPSFLFTNV